jgi:hypothetical protein
LEENIKVAENGEVPFPDEQEQPIEEQQYETCWNDEEKTWRDGQAYQVDKVWNESRLYNVETTVKATSAKVRVI